ncbi:MAG: tetratricopeptide repeat protein [Proteobacteria bacterium]|nr:tetratricopeptide repeat protein [Pseudomonadota bacterium]
MTFYKTIFSLFLTSIFCFSSVFAQTSYGDIQLLINEGKYKEALKLTDEQLSQSSSDIKLQFMKGLVLTRLDRYSDAEQVFIKLTKENPDLPEPFNNLAVVYAAQGKYTEASEALKSAINTHPSYATAHENLGDIYAKMASRAYNQALELDTSNTAAREKLSLVNELISAPSPSKPEKTVVAVAAPEAKPVSKPETRPEVKTLQEPEIITVPAKPAVKKDKESIKADPEEEKANNRNAVEAAIKSWANAWSAQDVDSYLASYGREFVPPKGLSRTAWEKERRVRLRKPRFIKISLANIKINLHGKDYAEIRFTQSYQSDTYGDKVKKEILMRKVNNRWLITQERTR